MNLYDIEVKQINQESISLNNYKGKVLLIVNTATHCGFTPQYKGLEALYQKNKDKGLEILDFPCNQFMNQAPESDEEIHHICEIDYQTTFPRFAKINVNGKDASPLYQYLKSHSPNELGPQLKKEGGLSNFIFGKRIKWNFTKFLVDRKGNVIYRFAPKVKPETIDQVISDII